MNELPENVQNNNENNPNNENNVNNENNQPNNDIDQRDGITGKEILDIKTYNPKRDEENVVDIRNPEIWSGFPFCERFLYSLFCKTKCCSDYRNGEFLSTDCLRNTCVKDPMVDLNNKILSISILKSGTLEIKELILHPFVRVSFINLKTGKFLQKSNFNTPCVSRQELNFIVQHNKVQDKLDLQSSILDFIPTISTCPYDLREKGEAFAEWNETFYINESADYLLNSDNIMFFELMDFSLDYEENPIENSIIPMAWGYLKMVGFSRTYLGKYKIQLYNYKFKRPEILNKLKNTKFEYIRTPDYLYEFDWIRKDKYQTFLEISLGLEDKPSEEDLNNTYIYNKFLYSVFVPEGDEIDINFLKYKKRQKLQAPKPTIPNEKTSQLFKWRRKPNEKCYIPNILIYKFPTAKLGCLTHEFSNNGKYIAAACTEMNSETYIKIFNVEDGFLRYRFKGHHNIIHHFSWSFDDLILISASADCNVSLWRVPKNEANDMNNLNYFDNELTFKICDIPHPAYVYSTAIYPENSNNLMILATACFDGIVRIYAINFNYEQNTYYYTLSKITRIFEIQISQEMEDTEYFKKISDNLKNQEGVRRKDKEKIMLLEKTALDHRHPNTIVFDRTRQLYIGDSLGYIHIWELNIERGIPNLQKIKSITHKDLEHDTINKITLIPNQTKTFLIHSRDNCIRLMNISKEKPQVNLRYFGSKCTKTNIKSTVSPDGVYILSGSEEGVPHMWSLDSGLPQSTSKFECGWVDSVSDVSWSNTYNMIALSSFGQEHPLLVYVFEKKDVKVEKGDVVIKKKNVVDEKDRDEEDDVLINDDYDNNAVGGNKILNRNQDMMSDFTKEYKTRIEKDVEDVHN
jgi:jouberin